MKSILRITKLTAALTIGLSVNIGWQNALAQEITTGNGQENWIAVDSMTRDGSTLTFSEIQIADSGWLVIHPFQNGAPNGDRVVGVTRLEAGINRDVSITVPKGLQSGEMMIVMLHSDSNHNGNFDFIFIDDRNVMDLAVFEGSTLIGHAVPAP
jgi:hypothetical protein